MDQILLPGILVYILNIPFGFWRAGTRKFSRNWYLAIPLPVPVVILLRVWYDLGWGWYSYAILVTAFFSGQLTGKLIRGKRNTKSGSNKDLTPGDNN